MFAVIQTPSPLHAVEEVVEQLCDVYDEISPDLLQILRLQRHLPAAGIKHGKTEHCRRLIFIFFAKWDFILIFPNLALSLKFFLIECVSVAFD